MITRNRFACGVAVLAGLGAYPAQGQRITMGPLVHVSKDLPAIRVDESLFCIDPNNPKRMFGGSHKAFYGIPKSNAAGNEHAVYASVDGGRSWKHVFDAKAANHQADPACAYGIDGAAYYGLMPTIGFKIDYRGYDVFRSEDGGTNWGKFVHIDYDRFFDRIYMSVDHGQGPHRGNLYVAGYGHSYPANTVQEPDQMVLFTSLDGARSFSGPATVPTGTGSGPEPMRGLTHPGTNTVLSDGTLILSWQALYMPPRTASDSATRSPKEGANMGAVRVARSSNGGKTLEGPFDVSYGAWTVTGGFNDSPADFIPVLAADTTNGPFRDRVYIAWNDMRGGRSMVCFSYSTDKGKTWTVAQQLSNNRAYDPTNTVEGPHDINPAIVVNNKGVVAVFYYEQRQKRYGYWPKLMVSLDGGETWSESMRLTNIPLARTSQKMVWRVWRTSYPGMSDSVPLRVMFDPEFPATSRPGDGPSGFDADRNGVFHAFPVIDPNGISQIYTRPVTVHATARAMREVFNDVRVDFGEYVYDRAAGIVTVDVRVTNISSEPMHGPVKLVLSEAPADTLERVDVLNADNKRIGVGAVWEFPIAGSAVVLQPGKSTGTRLLSFRFKRKGKTRFDKPGMSMEFRVLVAK
jgi:hypothetical protein